MTKSLKAISTLIYKLNQGIGRSLCWLVGIMAVTVFLIVLARAAVNYGSIALQETVTYMHGMVFLLCLAFTAQQGGHVRVDILYRKLSSAGQAWVNLCGAVIFLLPFSIFLLVISWGFVCESWVVRESSINPGGIAAVYLLKALMPASGFLLALRGFAEVVDHLIQLTFVSVDENL